MLPPKTGPAPVYLAGACALLVVLILAYLTLA